jgi:hypothetical protein
MDRLWDRTNALTRRVRHECACCAGFVSVAESASVAESVSVAGHRSLDLFKGTVSAKYAKALTI